MSPLGIVGLGNRLLETADFPVVGQVARLDPAGHESPDSPDSRLGVLGFVSRVDQSRGLERHATAHSLVRHDRDRKTAMLEKTIFRDD